MAVHAFLAETGGNGGNTGPTPTPFYCSARDYGKVVGSVDGRPDPTQQDGFWLALLDTDAAGLSAAQAAGNVLIPLDLATPLGMDAPVKDALTASRAAIKTALQAKGFPVSDLMLNWTCKELLAYIARIKLFWQWAWGQGLSFLEGEDPAALASFLGRRLDSLPPARQADVRGWLASKNFIVNKAYLDTGKTVGDLLYWMAQDLIHPDITSKRGHFDIPMLGWRHRLNTGVRSASKSYSESFNKADSDTLGPDQTWVEIFGYCKIVSNMARAGYEYAEPFFGGGEAYASSALLDTTDHYVETYLYHQWSCETQSGPFARCDGTRTFYHFGTAYNSGGGTGKAIFKCIGGAFTWIDSDLGFVSQGKHKIEVNGSTIKAFLNDSEIMSVVDASITSGKYGGFKGKGYSTDRWTDFDWINFADLAPATYDQPFHSEARGLRSGLARGIG